VDGLYRHEGIKKEDRILIAVVDKITGGIEALAQKGTDELGTGGMISKLQAAKTCASSGLSCIIANGKRPDVLTDIILKREKVGTLFLPASAKMGARKCWLGFCAKTKGHIKVDDGAKEALMRNKSLLASGVIGVGGDFKKDDIVSIVDSCGTEFARGAAGCDSPTIEKIKGLKTSQIHAVLGCRVDEIVHRDNLVIL
jgi:glutamate 5-kinase